MMCDKNPASERRVGARVKKCIVKSMSEKQNERMNTRER